MVGFTATILSALFGVLIGSLAGFYGGLLDALLMRVTEIFMVIPMFFVALVLVAMFGGNILNIVVAIALLSWPAQARLVRADFLTLKSRQFVEAARVAGARNTTLVFVEILPNALGPVIVAATLRVGQAILIESGLSYLGLGDPNHVSLGMMLQQAQSVMRMAWWTAVFPGLMIFLAVLSSNICGDALNDVVSPRSRSQ
jgi:peptide/nickel transport system permease protein